LHRFAEEFAFIVARWQSATGPETMNGSCVVSGVIRARGQFGMVA
jgi:hypothetical protein